MVNSEKLESCDFTAQKMEISIKDFFSKCDQISFQRIWSYQLKKSLMENLIFLCSAFSEIANFQIVFSKRVSLLFQKQPPRSVHRKRCSENMQQICRRAPMPKCDFNKVAWVTFRHGCSPVNLLHFFRTTCTKNTSGRLLLVFF